MSIATLIFIAAAVTPNATSMPTGQAIVNICWEGHSHVQMSECVLEQAAAARTTLSRDEQLLHESLSKKQKPALLSLFRSTVSSYHAYRTQQCRLQGALASAGNGADDVRLACEAALDIARSEQLKAGLWWLTPGA